MTKKAKSSSKKLALNKKSVLKLHDDSMKQVVGGVGHGKSPTDQTKVIGGNTGPCHSPTGMMGAAPPGGGSDGGDDG